MSSKTNCDRGRSRFVSWCAAIFQGLLWKHRAVPPESTPIRPEVNTVTLLLIPLQELVACLPAALQRQLAIKVRGKEILRLQIVQPSPPKPDAPIQITFGDLRKAALPGTFRNVPEHDQRVITIPPDMIRAALERSQALKPHGRKPSRAADQSLPKPPPSVTLPASEKTVKPLAEAVPTAVTATARNTSPAVNTLQSAANIPPANTSSPKAPSREAVSPAREVRRNNAPPNPAPAEKSIARELYPKNSPTSAQRAERKPGVEVPLEAMLSAWPENLKRALVPGDMVRRAFYFPLNRVEAGLKAGAFKVRWADLKQWLHPPLPAAFRVLSDATELEVPLEVVGPSFISQAMNRPTRQSVKVQADIPDIFSLPPKAPVGGESIPASRLPGSAENASYSFEVSNASAARASVLPQAVLEASSEAPSVDIATISESANLSPNEILQQLCRAPGVAGALLATADGLLVAAELPQQADDPQTIAAFAPQIFRQVTENVVRMHLGRALAASFALMNQEWRVYKADSVYLLIVMNAGHLPPTRELQTALNACARQTR